MNVFITAGAVLLLCAIAGLIAGGTVSTKSEKEPQNDQPII